MTRFRTATSLTLVAGLCALPAMAQQSQQQTQQQNQQQGGAGQMTQQLSDAGRACVDQLEQIDRDLAEMGYGAAGPAGYGIYGTAYRGPAVAGEQGSDALSRPLEVTPRSDMYALMRGGYVMARTGHDQVCQQIAQAAQDLGERYQAALSEEGYDRAGMAQWRGTYLAEATPVSELEQPLQAEQIIGSDVRNMEDRDLGDISDVLIGADGNIKYVIVQTGGFLGLGEEAVPVPWNDLKVTAAPYRDTFVLDVNEQTFGEAPRVEGNRTQLVEGQGGREVDSFWDQNLPDEG